MRIRTLGLYLIGDPDAIPELASDRRALAVGAIFVLSAALAREYDSAHLADQPWRLLLPFASSLAASFILFLITCGKLFTREKGRPPFLSTYRSFLTLFWFTAPMAWLYAVPYEQFLAPADAVRANLLTLALVSIWRIALMTRVVTVLTTYHLRTALMLVLAFGATIATGLAIANFSKPVIDIMGGVAEPTESEKVMRGVTWSATCLGFVALPVLWVLALIFLSREKPVWQARTGDESPRRRAYGLWILAAASVLFFAALLPGMQRGNFLRSRAEHDLRSGRVAEALDLMSAHARADFPPEWDPPPHMDEPKIQPHILDVMDVIAKQRRAPWVRQVYMEKFRTFLGPRGSFIPPRPGELALIARLLAEFPEGPQLAARFRNDIELKYHNEAEPHAPTDDENWKAITDL